MSGSGLQPVSQSSLGIHRVPMPASEDKLQAHEPSHVPYPSQGQSRLQTSEMLHGNEIEGPFTTQIGGQHEEHQRQKDLKNQLEFPTSGKPRSDTNFSNDTSEFHKSVVKGHLRAQVARPNDLVSKTQKSDLKGRRYDVDSSCSDHTEDSDAAAIERALAESRRRHKTSERRTTGPTLSQLRWRKSILHWRVARAFSDAGERLRARKRCQASWRVALYRVVAINHFLKALQTKRGARQRWRAAGIKIVAVQRFSRGPVEGRRFRSELKRCGLRVWSHQNGHVGGLKEMDKLSVVTSRLKGFPKVKSDENATTAPTLPKSRARTRATSAEAGVAVSTDDEEGDHIKVADHLSRLRENQARRGSIGTASENSEVMTDSEIEEILTDDEGQHSLGISSRLKQQPYQRGPRNPLLARIASLDTCGSETESEEEDDVIYHMDSVHELWTIGNENFERTWRSLSFHSRHEAELSRAIKPEGTHSPKSHPHQRVMSPALEKGGFLHLAKDNSNQIGNSKNLIGADVNTHDAETSSIIQGTEDDIIEAGLTASRTRAEDFEPLRIVGTGGSGQVYLVQHKETCKRFAMKVLNKAEIVTTNKIERIITEREILTRSEDSPFITHLQFAFHSDDMLFFVMEYCAGGNLHEAMLREHEIRKPTLEKERYRLAMDAAAEGQGLIGALSYIGYFEKPGWRRRAPRDLLLEFGLNPIHVQFIMGELVEGLLFLHRSGYVYRDLKPQNVMLNVDGHIRIGDFGISKAGTFDKDNGCVDLRSTSFVGTIEYMAPEVVSGENQSSAVDSWALGILLFELLYGAPPFWAIGIENGALSELEQRQLFMAILSPEKSLDFPLGVQVPDSARDLIIGCLCRRPHQRLKLEQIKRHSFFNGFNWMSLKNSSGFHKLVPRLHLHRQERKTSFSRQNSSNNIFLVGSTSSSDLFDVHEQALEPVDINARRKSLGAVQTRKSAFNTSDRSISAPQTTAPHRKSLSGRLPILRKRSQGTSTSSHSSGSLTPTSPSSPYSWAVNAGDLDENSAATAPFSMLPGLDIHVSDTHSHMDDSVSDFENGDACSYGGSDSRSRSSSATTSMEVTAGPHIGLHRSSSRSTWGRMKGWMRSMSGSKSPPSMPSSPVAPNETSMSSYIPLERAASEPMHAVNVAPSFCGHTHSVEKDERIGPQFHSGRTVEKDTNGNDLDSSMSEVGTGEDPSAVRRSLTASQHDSFRGFDWKAELA